jgi:hypothetical protein
MLNKAVSSEARIMLENDEGYNLSFDLSFLYPLGIENK